MIKFGKIYINPLTLAMLAVCFVTRHIEIFYITYGIMTLHELSHLLAAKLIGLRVAYIAFHPFGVNLKLKNKIIFKLTDEILLYLAGPLCNILLALLSVALYAYFKNPYLQFFYAVNITLFLANMLPVVPLDGGIILKKLLMYRVGSRAAGNIMKAVSAVVVLPIAVLGAYVLYTTHFNYSLLFLSVFLLGNTFTQKEKYNVDFIKELMFYRDKHSKKVRHRIFDENEDLKTAAKSFNAGSYSVAYFLDERGKIKNIMTETEIVDKILEK